MADYNRVQDQKNNGYNSDFKIQSTYNLMTKTTEQIVQEIGMEKQHNGELLQDQDAQASALEMNNITNKTLAQRLFSPMEAGSLRGSIFAMSSLALGTGCLALPKNFGNMSFVGALLTLCFGSAVAYWSLIIMIEASRKTNVKEYSRLVKSSLGNRLALFLDIMILIYIFGILISYQVIIYQLIGSFIYEVGFTSYPTFKEFNDNFWYLSQYKFPFMYIICALLIPLCLLKDISKMRFASLFSIASLIYAIFVIIIECPWYFDNFRKTHSLSELNWFDFSKGFDKHLYFFRGTATVFFAYTCHVGAFPVFKTLKNNVARRINKVFQRSILLDVVIYIIVGICGYLTQPLNTPDLIINRDKLLQTDIAMIIARFLIAINLILSAPANYNAFRLSVLEVVWGTTEIDNRKNLMITIPTLLITCLVGALYTGIIAYISILGGFCSVVIAFLFPGLLYIKNNELPVTHYKNILTIILITILCLIGFTAGIMTILDDILKVI